jgi:hypothetical protein
MRLVFSLSRLREGLRMKVSRRIRRSGRDSPPRHATRRHADP